jgi:hypothetical protein
MRTLTFLLCLLGILSSTSLGLAKSHHQAFDPNAEPIVIGTCYAEKIDLMQHQPHKVYRWTKYMAGHIGQKCWHIKGDAMTAKQMTERMEEMKAIARIKEQVLFQQFLDWHNSRPKK